MASRTPSHPRGHAVVRDVNPQEASARTRRRSLIVGAGSIRRLVSTYFANPTYVAVRTLFWRSYDPIGAGFAWLGRLRLVRLIGTRLVSGLYRLLVRGRANIRPMAARLSDLFERAMQEGASGERLLNFSQRLVRRGWRTPARLSLFLVRYGLVLSVQAHLVASQHARAEKAARLLNCLFRPYVLARQAPEAQIFFHALLRTKAFDRIAREFPRHEDLNSYYMARFAGVSHLYCLNIKLAKEFLEQAIALADNSCWLVYRMLGRAYLVEGDYDSAASKFEAAVILRRVTVMAHHNYAGRYDIHTYKPKSWELTHAGQLLIYDNLMQFAEDLFLSGRAHDSLRFYQSALAYQSVLAKRFNLPKRLERRLADEFESFDPALPTRLLAYEWVTQFGHIGLLDSYKKMAELGMYPKANYVLLAPPGKVSNATYLSYWDPHFHIVRDEELVDELFPYQRVVGDQFMAFPSDGQAAELWTRAAARVQVEWAEQRRGPLLELTNENRRRGERGLRRLGFPSDAWYVGLHVREGGFHGDHADTNEHRRADIEDYFEAIEEITSRGGWVIRLGDSSTTPLPEMANVIDYAHSREKSELVDIFLLATSRFIIGTTSGLSTVAMSFGTPMLLVNCISNDWQIWTDGVDFIPRHVYDFRSRRYLSLGETYRQPLQGYLINNVLLTRLGYAVHANSPADIRAAVKYKLDTLTGGVPRADEDHPLMQRYRQALAHNPYMFGAAKPVLPFLETHPELLSLEPNAKAEARIAV